MLRGVVGNYEKDKAALAQSKARLLQSEKHLKHLEWENEVSSDMLRTQQSAALPHANMINASVQQLLYTVIAQKFIYKQPYHNVMELPKGHVQALQLQHFVKMVTDRDQACKSCRCSSKCAACGLQG